MRKIILFTALSLFTFAALQLGLSRYLQRRVADGTWIESVASKSELLSQRPDVRLILLGTSTTQNHFNTNWMTNQGLSSFNFGLPGRYWEDFPSIIDSFRTSRASHVMLSLSARVFLYPVSCPAFRTLYDVTFFYRLRGLECWRKFNIKHLFPLYSDWPFIGEVFRPTKDYFATTLLRYKTDLANDPRLVNYVRGNNDRSVVTYRNGDGAVFSDSVAQAPAESVQLRLIDKRKWPLDPEALRFVTALGREVEAQGKKLIINLEPRRANETILINVELLKNALGPSVLVLTNHALTIPRENWADFTHLKPAAAQVYTELVTCQLKHPDTPPSCQTFLEKLASVLP